MGRKTKEVVKIDNKINLFFLLVIILIIAIAFIKSFFLDTYSKEFTSKDGRKIEVIFSKVNDEIIIHNYVIKQGFEIIHTNKKNYKQELEKCINKPGSTSDITLGL